MFFSMCIYIYHLRCMLKEHVPRQHLLGLPTFFGARDVNVGGL